MKHTLFLTMLAAALLGSGNANAADYRVSDYSEYDNLNCGVGEATIVVDAQNTFSTISAISSNCLTLDYQDNFVLTADLEIELFSVFGGVLNITSTVDTVQTKWEDTFSVEGGGPITIVLSNILPVQPPQNRLLQFLGTDEGSTVKLGDTEVKFVGVVSGLETLDRNEVGVMWGKYDITLVGKVQKSVPEPTTGSLSLLALAGLCARRRK